MVSPSPFIDNKITCVFFDFIGTLVKLSPDYEASLNYLYETIKRDGLTSSLEEFKKAYAAAYEMYLRVRQTEYREVTNSVWLTEALNSLGYPVSERERHIAAAINEYFDVFTAPTQSISCVKGILEQARKKYRLGLISNFTYAPAVYKMLRRFDLLHFFGSVTISHEVGFRKPHPNIFRKALKDTRTSPEEAVMIGDTLKEDIVGAKVLGIRTVLIDVYGPKDESFENELRKNPPDLIIQDICELREIL